MSTPTRHSRTLGALLGVHAGDSLGATLEFLAWEEIQMSYPDGLHEIIGGGHFDWPAGHATDDTDLTRAVLLAYRDVHVRAAKGTSNPAGREKGVVELAAWRMVDWYDGVWPGRVKGRRPRDVGGATETGLRRFRSLGDPASSGAGEGNAGNGSLMRCIATGLFVGDGEGETERLVRESMAISAVTHDDLHCTIACAAYNGIVRALVAGRGVDIAIEEGKGVVKVCLEQLEGAGKGGARVELAAKRVVAGIDAGRELISVKEMAEKGPKEAKNVAKVIPFKGAGYVLESFTIAVAALMDPRPLEEVLADVVRFGKDTDTNGAIAGGLLGARDGVDAIPLQWREKLQFGKEFGEAVDVILGSD